MQLTSLSGGGSSATATQAQTPVRTHEPPAHQPATSAPDRTSPGVQQEAELASRLMLQSSFVEKLILHAKADASLAAYAQGSGTAPSSAAVAASYAEF